MMAGQLSWWWGWSGRLVRDLVVVGWGHRLPLSVVLDVVDDCCCPGGCAPPVALDIEFEDGGWWTRRSMAATVIAGSGKILSHAEKGWLAVIRGSAARNTRR